MMNPLNSYLEKFQATILAYVRFDLQRCLGSSIVSECAPSEFREPTELRSPSFSLPVRSQRDQPR